ncbi:efflux transporter outer membrane subunit [Oxalobacteraceae bacterium CAVE-383]|nr:efflux transporter outer membrane subunit [Oxalobacteraceae bacterium CAVE-383]
MKLTHCFPAAMLMAAAALAGCSLQPVYQRPPASVPDAYPAGAAYGSAAAASAPAHNAAGPAAADIGWNDFLLDPRLRRLVDLGLQNNRDLRVAMLNVQKVQAQYRIQRAAMAPQIDAGAGVTQARTPASVSSSRAVSMTHDYSTGFSAAWEVDFFGRLRSLSDAALQQYLASAYARQSAEILLVSQIADQYLVTLADDEQLAVTANTLRAAQASYKIMKLQFDTGTASELDLRLAQTIMEQSQANYAAQTRLRAQAENALALLIGQPLPRDLPPPATLDLQLLADIPVDLPSGLLARRPDILQAEALLRSENANIGAARAAFFPRISLTGTLGSESASLGALFGAGSAAWSFIPSIALPIFNGGANRANLDIAKLDKDIGIAQYQKTIQTAFREVVDGLAARGTYDSQVAAQLRDAEAQQRRLDLENMLFQNGIDSYQNVLTAETDLYGAQQQLVAARLNRLTAMVDLYRALGGGWIRHTGDAPRLAEAAGVSGVPPD